MTQRHAARPPRPPPRRAAAELLASAPRCARPRCRRCGEDAELARTGAALERERGHLPRVVDREDEVRGVPGRAARVREAGPCRAARGRSSRAGSGGRRRCSRRSPRRSRPPAQTMATRSGLWHVRSRTCSATPVHISPRLPGPDPSDAARGEGRASAADRERRLFCAPISPSTFLMTSGVAQPRSASVVRRRTTSSAFCAHSWRPRRRPGRRCPGRRARAARAGRVVERRGEHLGDERSVEPAEVGAQSPGEPRREGGSVEARGAQAAARAAIDLVQPEIGAKLLQGVEGYSPVRGQLASCDAEHPAFSAHVDRLTTGARGTPAPPGGRGGRHRSPGRGRCEERGIDRDRGLGEHLVDVCLLDPDPAGSPS